MNLIMHVYFGFRSKKWKLFSATSVKYISPKWIRTFVVLLHHLQILIHCWTILIWSKISYFSQQRTRSMIKMPVSVSFELSSFEFFFVWWRTLTKMIISFIFSSTYSILEYPFTGNWCTTFLIVWLSILVFIFLLVACVCFCCSI